MELVKVWVSIPSRGFWFFEADLASRPRAAGRFCKFQSPRGDFGFLKDTTDDEQRPHRNLLTFQSPRGDFGFLKKSGISQRAVLLKASRFQSPRGDFGFLKAVPRWRRGSLARISIPSRGFWFFEGFIDT